MKKIVLAERTVGKCEFRASWAVNGQIGMDRAAPEAHRGRAELQAVRPWPSVITGRPQPEAQPIERTSLAFSRARLCLVTLHDPAAIVLSTVTKKRDVRLV